jgi:hypothetical protein
LIALTIDGARGDTFEKAEDGAQLMEGSLHRQRLCQVDVGKALSIF